jgi:pyruvate dehydrogenase E2 component (dihydrolipoamide acetyltransferase)
MPILTADMSAGTLVRWRKQPGDSVRRGDIVAQVETDKGLIDVEAFVTGVLERVLVGPGVLVPTGTVLATIREEGVLAAPAGPAPSPLPAPAPMAARPMPPAPPPVGTAGRLRISPLARKIAADLGIDPASVTGTGPGGVITRDDVEAAARGAVPAAPAAARTPVDRQARMRQAIAAAMARSKREIPHYYLATTIDMHRALAWLAEENARRPVTERLLHGALLIKAVALALREVPELNSVWRGGEVIRAPGIHVGVGISLRAGGLVAPAVHDTDRRTVSDLMATLRDLVHRARTGGLRSSELSDATITVTSLGDQGVETVFGIVYPPQVAIVGFGKPVERPWIASGQVVGRPLITATLSADHRVSDGHRGALFLAAVDRRLQEPGQL